MKKQDMGASPIRDQRVTLAARLSQQDRAMADRVVLGDTPSHKVEGDPWATTLLRRIGEDVMVRDYLCTFAHSEDGARRILGLGLGLSRMAKRKDSVGAAALSVAGWGALALGSWELADSLAVESLKAEKDYPLGQLIRQVVAERWFADLLDVESNVCVGRVQQCSIEVLRRLVEPRAYIHLG